MRYTQLFENSDYNIARKIRSTLSKKAQKILDEWDKFFTDGSELNNEFKNKTPIAKEIWNAGQPIRDNIRNRVGDKITLYRGLAEYDPDNRPKNRMLFSWTSSEKVARCFAETNEIELKHITKKETNVVIKKFNERGYVSFLGRKFLKRKNKNKNEFYDEDDYVVVYNDENKYIDTFDNIKQAIDNYVYKHNKKVQNYKEKTKNSRVFKKRIPVNNIIWVSMYQETKDFFPENEYIVLNYSK